jgi:hypothetical protein
MKVDGVWKIRVRGPYGKQTIGTGFLRKGCFLSANADHYSIGSYRVKDDSFKAKLHITRFGQTPPIFGSKKREIDIHIKGKILKSGKKIVCVSHLDGSKQFVMDINLTRLGDLD